MSSEFFALRRREQTYDPDRDGRIEQVGDLSVIRTIVEQARERRDALDRGEQLAAGTRVGLFILPGVQRGVYGGGQVTALHELGLTEGIDVVVGSSTGVPTAAYFLAGNPREGTTIYSEECTSPDFIRFKRLPDGYAEDAKFLADVFRGMTGKRLRTETIAGVRQDFIIALTEYDNGRPALLHARTAPDLINAIQAAITMPILITQLPPLRPNH